MPKRSMVAIFGPELECVLFVAGPPDLPEIISRRSKQPKKRPNGLLG